MPADDQVTPLTAIEESAVHGPAASTTTHWSMVLEAQGPTAAAQEALDKICRIYWRPIYGFVRRQGVRPEEAKDLTTARKGTEPLRVVVLGDGCISEQTRLALLGRTERYHTCGSAHGPYHAPLVTDNLSQSDESIR